MAEKQQVTQEAQAYYAMSKMGEDYKRYQETNALINKITKLLRAERMNIFTKKMESYGKPLLNKEGINSIQIYLRSKLDYNIFGSNLTKEEINDVMKRFGMGLTTNLVLNYNSYEIKKENLDGIWNLVMDSVYFALKRSQNEGERKFIKGTEKIIREERLESKEPRQGWGLRRRSE